MNKILRLVSWLSLIFLILPSILYLAGSLELPAVKTWMIWVTFIWFITAGYVGYNDSKNQAT